MSIDSSFVRGAAVIRAYVRDLPDLPGVYRMIGNDGSILYVGKAKNLKNRVSSYTSQNQLSVRIMRMVSETVTMAFVQTHTEIEALLLEANFIKTLKPKYNILLKDDKFFSYVYLSDHIFPRLQKYRGNKQGDGQFFGPFTSGDAVDRTLISLYKIFRLRSCSDAVFTARKRPCLQYHIKRCSAPCVGFISKDDYDGAIAQAAGFLSGKQQDVQKQLADKMQSASTNQDYEKAATYRDQIRALTHIQSQQTVHLIGTQEADVLAAVSVGGQICIHLFLYRWGVQCGSHSFFPSHTDGMSECEALSAFVPLFYNDNPPPSLILINHPMPDQDLTARALSAAHKKSVTIRFPKRGPKQNLIENAYQNGVNALGRHLLETRTKAHRFAEMKKVFNLPALPQRIEIYDNSHIQGTHAIGAMVVSGPDGFLKKHYRKFIIQTAATGEIRAGDDYGMMREVLRRRFSGSLAQNAADNPLPDLVLIDGGIGQLNAVLGVFRDLNLTIPVVAIAKGPDRNAGRETFFQEGRAPFMLNDYPSLLFYLQNLRDESHRYAIGFHREKRQKHLTQSSLDGIPGIGAARRRALLRHFGSARDVGRAGIKDLEQVDGISAAIAAKIYAHFH